MQISTAYFVGLSNPFDNLIPCKATYSRIRPHFRRCSTVPTALAGPGNDQNTMLTSKCPAGAFFVLLTDALGERLRGPLPGELHHVENALDFWSFMLCSSPKKPISDTQLRAGNDFPCLATSHEHDIERAAMLSLPFESRPY